MATDANATSHSFHSGLRLAHILIGLTGAAFLAVVAWGVATTQTVPFTGLHIYDAYYMAILDGRLDLPPRLLIFEGHYLPDGTGYLYHGLAPLLTRFAFGWAWPFDAASMSGISIWAWAALGTAFYQTALVDLARQGGALNSPNGRSWTLILGATLWIGGPALLLVANHAFYHEPIAVAFAAVGAFVTVWVKMTLRRMRFGTALILLALCAAVSVHARPNLAVGLYAGVAIAMGWGLWRYRARLLLPSLVAGATLAAGGIGYLTMNELRFGDVTETHGSFEKSAVQIGTVFWGLEDPSSPRAAAFEEHGRFNIQRVLPNALLYFADIPASQFLTAPSEVLLNWFRSATEPRLGVIRVEKPRIGLLLLWPVWCALALLGLFAVRRTPGMIGLVVALAIATGLTLSYATITLRYRIDLWPFVAVLAFPGAPLLLPRLVRQGPFLSLSLLFGGLLMVGTVVSTFTADHYQYKFHAESWSYDVCAELVARAGLPVEKVSTICRTPWGDDT